MGGSFWIAEHGFREGHFCNLAGESPTGVSKECTALSIWFVLDVVAGTFQGFGVQKCRVAGAATDDYRGVGVESVEMGAVKVGNCIGRGEEPVLMDVGEFAGTR